MDTTKSIFWNNSNIIIGLLILVSGLYLINKKLNLIENFPHEDGHIEGPEECTPTGGFTRTGLIKCQDGVCSNEQCCSALSTPRDIWLIGKMKCINYEEARRIKIN